MSRSSVTPEQNRSSSPSSSCSSPVRSIHIPVQVSLSLQPRAEPEPGPEPRRMNEASVTFRSRRVRVCLQPVRLRTRVQRGTAGPKVSLSLRQNRVGTACSSVHVRPGPAESGPGPGAPAGFMGSYATPNQERNPATFTEPPSPSRNFRLPPAEFQNRAWRTGSGSGKIQTKKVESQLQEERLIRLPAANRAVPVRPCGRGFQGGHAPFSKRGGAVQRDPPLY